MAEEESTRPMEMELYEIGRILRRRWLLIAVVTVLLLAAASVWSFWLSEPEYEATTTLLVQSETQNQIVSVNELVANQKLLTTYGEIIKSHQIADDVIRRLNLRMTAEQLLDKVKVKAASESLVTSVTVQDKDPKQAVAIANGFAVSFSGNLNSILKVDNVSVLDEAKLISASVPVSPRPVLNISIALVLGLLAGCGGALLAEQLDRTVKSEEEVEELLSLPLLGTITLFEKGRSKQPQSSLIALDTPKSPIAESYRTLRTNIQFAGVSRDLQSLLVTSAEPGEGKTTTTCNLAVTLAQTGKKVLLIDGDLRKSSVHAAFQLSNRFGLTSLLIREAQPSEVIQEIPEIGLHVITAGPTPPNPAELLGSRRMQELLEGWKRDYDMVLIDTAPVLAVTDAQVLAQLNEGVLLVLGSGKVLRDRVKKAKALLDRVRAPLIGTVLNRKKLEKGSQQQYYYMEQS